MKTLKEQSDQGLSCLSSPFRQATNVRNFRTFTIMVIICKYQNKTGLDLDI